MRERVVCVLHRKADVHVDVVVIGGAVSNDQQNGHFVVCKRSVSGSGASAALICREWCTMRALAQQSTNADDFLHIVRCIRFEESEREGESLPRLYLELVDGCPLHRMIRLQGAISVDIARVYSYEIAQALTVLHEKFRCIHRDLKASNVLISSRGHVKVTDFGSARLMPANGCQERAYTVTGSVHCMAPEMVAKDNGYTFSVDWWGLGILVYEMLTGSPPALRWWTSSNLTGQLQWQPTAAQSQSAQLAIANEDLTNKNEWDVEIVNELLTVHYPMPKIPLGGDVLNHMHLIEQRLAHEDVRLAETFIRALLVTNPEKRLQLRLSQLDDQTHGYSWLRPPRRRPRGSDRGDALEWQTGSTEVELEPLPFDSRAGHTEVLQALSIARGDAATNPDLDIDQSLFHDF